ncbi:hypothetical protein ES703_117381 [subsurface metagenome]
MRKFTKRIIDNLKIKKVDYGDVRVVERETTIRQDMNLLTH